MARPSKFTNKLAASICAKLASGQPLVKICREESMPSSTTVYRWLADNRGFREMYARAREDQADTLADEIVAIADEQMVGAKVTTKANGDVERVEGDMIEHRKLRVDARKWTAAKLRPRKYGELVRQELSGPDGGPVPVKMVMPSYEELRAELNRRRPDAG